MKQYPASGGMDDPKPCTCIQDGKERCECDVPFIGSQAEAERRIQAGTLKGVDLKSIREALIQDWTGESHA